MPNKTYAKDRNETTRTRYAATSRGPRSLKSFVVLALAILLVMSAILLAACSKGPQTYTDDDFGFSFEYPGSWAIQHMSPAALSPGVAKEVGAFDQDGSDAGDEYTWDMVSVEVYQGGMDLDYTLDDISTMNDEYLADLQEQEPTLQVLESVTPVIVGGLDGYKITYTGSVGSTQIHCSEYTLLSHSVIYNLWTQAAEENWDSNQSVFADFLASFIPGD